MNKNGLSLWTLCSVYDVVVTFSSGSGRILFAFPEVNVLDRVGAILLLPDFKSVIVARGPENDQGVAVCTEITGHGDETTDGLSLGDGTGDDSAGFGGTCEETKVGGRWCEGSVEAKDVECSVVGGAGEEGRVVGEGEGLDGGVGCAAAKGDELLGGRSSENTDQGALSGGDGKAGAVVVEGEELEGGIGNSLGSWGGSGR